MLRVLVGTAAVAVLAASCGGDDAGHQAGAEGGEGGGSGSGAPSGSGGSLAGPDGAGKGAGANASGGAPDTSNAGKSSIGGQPGGGESYGGVPSAIGGQASASGGEGGSVQGSSGRGTEAGGGGGDAGEGNVSVDTSVTGKVVDFFGHPLSNVVIQIGDEVTSSDDSGSFAIEDVASEYEVSLLVKRDDGDKWYGWVYQGLTRRDPTLQVYQGRDTRWCTWVSKATGATLGVNDTITTSLGTPDGNASDEDIDPTGSNDYHDWEGTAVTSGTGHALHWTNNAATSLPSSYKAYDAKLLAFADGEAGEVSYDLSPDAVASDTITGSVSPAGEDDRTNMVFLRFASGASIKLAEHEPSANAFSYLVPGIAGASVSLAAFEGSFFGPLGLVHKEGLNAGDAAGTLDIPRPAQPLNPGGTTVDAETAEFRFNPSPDNAGAFVVTIESDAVWEAIYVVTTSTQFTVPSVVGGALPLRAGENYRWWVETHGDVATVDEMTGPQGFADPYSHPYFGYVPTGLAQVDGSYTFSGYSGFSVSE